VSVFCCSRSFFLTCVVKKNELFHFATVGTKSEPFVFILSSI